MEREIFLQDKGRLIDPFGRRINYLRLSVTDKCNLKCLYCFPVEKIEYLSHSEICSYDELCQVVQVAAELGIEKVRLTGGELFLRKDILSFIRSLSGLQGIREVVLTTNGTLLLPHLVSLKEIGIRRINISLDTLNEDKYSAITGKNDFSSVQEAIHRAADMGFIVKINMVALRGINDMEIPEFVRYFLEHSLEVRFIECMPLNGSTWNLELMIPYDEILELIKRKFRLRPLLSDGVARLFAAIDDEGREGKIGVISPLTCSFCSSCARLRLSASGELRPCLFSRKKVKLLPLLRKKVSLPEKEENIRKALGEAVRIKPLSLSETHAPSGVYIRSLGG